MIEPLDLSPVVHWLVFTSVVGVVLLAFAAAVKGDKIARRLFVAWSGQGGYRTLREELTAVRSMFICLVTFSAWMVFDNWWALLVPVGFVGGACMRAWIRNNLYSRTDG